MDVRDGAGRGVDEQQGGARGLPAEDELRGDRFVERILTAASSRQTQGRGVMDFLTRAVTTRQTQTETPPLLPQGA